MDKFEVLRQYFGHSSFREGQEEIIDALTAGRDALAIMPTGAGKSLCYQVPALMLDGVTLVISPLIALMKDQVASLKESGVAAAYLNSSLTPYQQELMLQRASLGQYKIIYVAPERLTSAGFLAFASETKISLVAVDEAHCVSQWGQDFRPSYLEIARFVEKLPERPSVAAFTATATERVRDDICSMLELRAPKTVVGSFDRPNLRFEVRRPGDKYGTLVGILSGLKGQSGIVYCLTRKNVEDVSEKLERDGFSVTRYHAGLSQSERSANQEDFLYDRKLIVVATCAFGMGIDKSNVSFVIHYNMPGDMESYYQEAGRAGRDGSPARCILLYNRQDIITNKYIIEHSEEENENDALTPEQREQNRRNTLARLNQMVDYSETVGCLRAYILRYFGEDPPRSCGSCGNCAEPVEMADITEDGQKAVSCVIRMERMGRRFGRGVLSDMLRGKTDDMIERYDLQEIKTFGAMSGATQQHIRAVIDAALAGGYLELTGGEYPVLVSGPNAMKLLGGEAKLEARADSIGKRAQRKRAKSEAEKKFGASLTITTQGTLEDMAPLDEALYEKLRLHRTELARAAGKPPFIIFTDAVLRNICRLMPTDKSSFGLVPGVGAHRTEKYADGFTEIIRAYIEDGKQEQPAEDSPAPKKDFITGRLSKSERDPLWLTQERIDAVAVIEEPISVNYLAEIINEQADFRTMQRTSGAKVNAWLLACGYLRTEGACKVPTEAGERLGISCEQRTGRNGQILYISFYSTEAQRFVAQHINMISAGEIPADAPAMLEQSRSDTEA